MLKVHFLYCERVTCHITCFSEIILFKILVS